MKNNSNSAPARRDLFRGAAALAGSAVLLPAATTNSPVSSGSLLVATSGKAVVETTAGKVRGYIRNGISTFKGIPYGAPVGEASRWLPAVKPQPWTGIRSSMAYGWVCPQAVRAGWQDDEQAFMFEWEDGNPREDCLRINVWTPATDNRKRAVMVWLHGGGFSAGSAQELKSYDGENLAKRGDVVLVSLNHRLNVLGHLNLAAYGEKYANSANVGMTDIVLALEWVRDNISNFGGDPNNVTIFGQSGGGGKVSTLMAMPSAKGLFHKAIVQSATGVRVASAETTAKVAAETLSQLGLTAARVADLHTVPYEKLLAATDAAYRKVQPTQRSGGIRSISRGERAGYAPTVDGKIVTQHPFDPRGPEVSAHVPLLVGTALNEMMTATSHPEYEAMTEAEVRSRVDQAYPGKGNRIVDAFRKAYPKSKAFDILSFIGAQAQRHDSVVQATRKAAQGAAPAWMYLFAWQTPVLDGRPRAFHCSELPFCFYNTDRAAAMTGGSAEARDLAARVSDAWLHFAKKGDPNHPGLPKWSGFSAANPAVMYFDTKCELRLDPEQEARKAITEA